MKRATPLTEAMIDSCGDYEKGYRYRGRFAEFARNLERELAQARDGALEKAARIVEKRAENRVHSTASYDPETGAWEYPEHAEDIGNSLDEEADDCAAAIRALKSPAQGATINAAGQDRHPSDQGSENPVRLPQSGTTPAPAAPSTAPQEARLPDVKDVARVEPSTADLCVGTQTAPAAAVPDDPVHASYMELIYAVARKWAGETRHQTALRYILERENMPSNPAAAKREADRG